VTGQLGLPGLPNQEISPVVIPGITGVTGISAGHYATLLMTTDGIILATGYNENGQLGLGHTNDQHTPIVIPSISEIISMAAGHDHSLFLKSDGTVLATGGNQRGQLGLGHTNDQHTPTVIPGILGVTYVAAGAWSSHFLIDGTIWAAGVNSFGKLGLGGASMQTCGDACALTPMQVPDISGVASIECGHTHTLFLKADGTVLGSGENKRGCLGLGRNTGHVDTPGIIPGPDSLLDSITGVTAVAAGSARSLFLKSDGKVWGVGGNFFGQLGLGDYDDVNRVIEIPGISDVISMDAGSTTTNFVKADGTVWGMGRADKGMLGLGFTVDIPASPNTVVQTPGITGATAVRAGDLHTVVLQAV
jgi:alpha-tubulin suppressor-like RCC1 family protein